MKNPSNVFRGVRHKQSKSMKENDFAKIIILVISTTLFSCSANWHLNQAIRKGAKVKVDTVTLQVITERTITDTLALLKEVTKRDTITLNTMRWRSKTVIKDTTIWQQVECKPDTVIIKVPVKTEIKATHNWRNYFFLLIGVLVILMIINRKLK